MKSLLLLLIFLFTCLSIHAQDTLFKKNKRRVLCKVLEASGDTIRYNQYSMPDGPVYTIAKSELSRIVYENGRVDSFEPVATVEQPRNHTGPGPGPERTQPSTGTSILSNRYMLEENRHRFYVDGRRSSQRMQIKIMNQVKDPQIFLHLQTAHSRKLEGTLCGIASIPVSIAGVFGFLLGSVAESQNNMVGATSGPNNTSAYQYINPKPFYILGAVTLFSGVSLKVGSVFLKKFSDKAYRQALDQYNQAPM